MKELVVDRDVLLSENEYVFEIPSDSIRNWCLMITLLVNELIDSLTLRFRNHSLKICLSEDADEARFQTLSRNDSKTELQISKGQLEYLQFTLLRTFRDALAEVQHIHLEGNDGKVEFDLTVFFEDFSKPMSAEEVSKLIKE